MRKRDDLTTSRLVRVLLPVLLAGVVTAGCSGDEDGGAGGDATGPGDLGSTAPTTSGVHPVVALGKVTGTVEKPLQRAAAKAVTATVVEWAEQAYLAGDYPRRRFAAYGGFTRGAAGMATDDRAVTSNATIGPKVTDVEPLQLKVVVDLLGSGGQPQGATARVRIRFRTEGRPAGVHTVSGRVTLVPAQGRWRIFGYDLNRAGPGVPLRKAKAGDVGQGTLWILAVGSDARPGQPPLRSRGDALQLVGLNTRTGAVTVIGIPRDSYVSIPGHSSDRINSALVSGGPDLLGRTVGNLVGIQPDYVFVATFRGLADAINGIGGITVNSDVAFSGELRKQGFKRGLNRLTGDGAIAFSRIRKSLPRGDFQRSEHQQETMRAIQAALVKGKVRPGFLELGTLLVAHELHTGLSVGELFRIAQAVASIDPRKAGGCVVQGSNADVGGASVVLPYVGAARRYGADARYDAVISHC